MPSLRTFLDNAPTMTPNELTKRINIKVTSSSPPGLIAASKQDPWSQAGKYSLGWVYFSIIVLVFTGALYWYHYWTDKLRRATFKEEIAKSSKTSSPDTDYEMANLPTNCSSRKFFPGDGDLPQEPVSELPNFSFGPFNTIVALVRFVFYRPLPILTYRKRVFQLPTAGVIFMVFAATAFVTLYTFLPQPYFYTDIAFGSPPLAIRAGMIAVAMMPWIIGLSVKSNLITLITGIGHERLNVLHRWASYIFLFLSLVHTVPFYITPIWDEGGLNTWKKYFNTGYYPYGSGWAALAPLLAITLHSLPFVRSWSYEVFVVAHVPLSVALLGLLFWHCHNYLTSWNYLWATTAIWLASYFTRLLYLNWANPFRKASWLVGEPASVTVLPENAVKVTVATQIRWTPGQYVYLRMPHISYMQNHPFTIASLCSEDFPSEYGEQYRDMTLVFRPFGGFTRQVLDQAIKDQTLTERKDYTALIDGPYGGMRRELASFDTVILFAGGSGITAIVSHLLDLIKKMRDSKAVTKQVHLVWALKRPETMEWFKEEIRICREAAPPETVHCQFFITAAKRQLPGQQQFPPSPSRPIHDLLHKQVDKAFDGIASKRHSAILREIQDEAAGDSEKEQELRSENEDSINPLPHATFLPPPKKAVRRQHKPTLSVPTSNPAPPTDKTNFDFGFPSTPTMLQKNLMRFAFMPAINPKKSSWSTEYGRPDIPYMLKGFERAFGKRTCVFVCGPPSMRVDVQKVVARMQKNIWSSDREELFLHTENYSI